MAGRRDLYSSRGPLVLSLAGHRFHRCDDRLLAGRRCAMPRRPNACYARRSAIHRIRNPASSTLIRFASMVRRRLPRNESGRNSAPSLPQSIGSIFEQHPRAGSLRHQKTGEGQAGLSRAQGSRAKDCRLRGHAQDPQGVGAVGQRR
jgi:hypothetical protein